MDNRVSQLPPNLDDGNQYTEETDIVLETLKPSDVSNFYKTKRRG